MIKRSLGRSLYDATWESPQTVQANVISCILTWNKSNIRCCPTANQRTNKNLLELFSCFQQSSNKNKNMMFFKPSMRSFPFTVVEKHMAQSPHIGLYCPSTNLPFGIWPIYFNLNVHQKIYLGHDRLSLSLTLTSSQHRLVTTPHRMRESEHDSYDSWHVLPNVVLPGSDLCFCMNVDCKVGQKTSYLYGVTTPINGLING